MNKTATQPARSMYRMKKGQFIVFADLGNSGYTLLKKIRRDDPRFKGARIQSVIQCEPERTPEGKVLLIGE